jgi:hypothetical protein
MVPERARRQLDAAAPPIFSVMTAAASRILPVNSGTAVVEHGHGNRVHGGLMLAEGGRETTLADPCELLEQEVHADYGARGIGHEANPRKAYDLALRSVRKENLSRRRGMQRQVPHAPVMTLAGCIGRGDGDDSVAFEHSERGRLLH